MNFAKYTPNCSCIFFAIWWILSPLQHYVPLNDQATNVEERMKWVVEHEDEARRISELATLWMEDLVFHPDAQEDDRQIQEEILRRYQAHFLPFDMASAL